jgi:hypothetical protein
LKVNKGLNLFPSISLSQFAIADLNFKIRVWKGDYIGKARLRFMKFAEVPDQEGSIGLYLVLESEEWLAGEGMRDLHFDEVLLFPKAEGTGFIYGVDDG